MCPHHHHHQDVSYYLIFYLSTWHGTPLRMGTDVCAQSLAAWSVTHEGRGDRWSAGEEADLQMKLWSGSSPVCPGPKREGAPGFWLVSAAGAGLGGHQ